MGERPAILSRGYARTRPVDGVVVVRDADGIRSDLGRSGDEPLMLARRLDGASVLVSPDRYLAGCLAERQFGATVHVLDDGFQHLPLERDIDILIIGREDIQRPLTLPAGRLREPLDTCIAADAIVAADDDIEMDVAGMEMPMFRTRRAIGSPVGFTGGSAAFSFDRSANVVAVAGIASPRRFFDDLRAAGYSVAEGIEFKDHHPFSAADVRRICARERHGRGSRADHREGFCPAAPAPAICRPGRMGAAYNGADRSRIFAAGWPGRGCCARRDPCNQSRACRIRNPELRVLDQQVAGSARRRTAAPDVPAQARVHRGVERGRRRPRYCRCQLSSAPGPFSAAPSTGWIRAPAARGEEPPGGVSAPVRAPVRCHREGDVFAFWDGCCRRC